MIRTGDKVKILNENAEGIVKKIISAKFAFVQIGDFDYEYSIDNLVKIEEEISALLNEKFFDQKIHPQIKDAIVEKENSQAGIKKVKLKKGKKSPLVTEVDLHSSEIIVDSTGMTSDQILNYQLQYFLRELDSAISKREKQIIFIHGKGEGILKAEICQILKSYDLQFYDAPLQFYGGGATLVEISNR